MSNPQQEVDLSKMSKEELMALAQSQGEKISNLYMAAQGAMSRARELEDEKSEKEDSMFGFLSQMSEGVVEVGVFKQNEDMEWDFCPGGNIKWNVKTVNKLRFLDIIANKFGPGKFQLELSFPDSTGFSSRAIEISVSKPKDEPAPPPPKEEKDDSSDVLARTISEQQDRMLQFMREQREETKQMMQGFIEAIRDKPVEQRADPMAMLAALLAGVSQMQKPMLDALAAVKIPQLPAREPQVQQPSVAEQLPAMMSFMKDIMLTGAELGANAQMSPEAAAAEGGGSSSVMEKFFGMLIDRAPALLSMLSPGGPTGAQTMHPQPKVGDAPQQPAGSHQQMTEQQKAQAAYNGLVKLVNDKPPQEAAAAIRQAAPPQFVAYLVKNDIKTTLAMVSKIVPDAAKDPGFVMKFKGVVNALKTGVQAQ